MPRGVRTPEPDPADAEAALSLLRAGRSRRTVSDLTGLTYYQLWRLEEPEVDEDERTRNVERLARNGWTPREIAGILGVPLARVARRLRSHPVAADAEAIETEMEDEYTRMLMERPQ